MTPLPLRSALFVPAANARALAKSASLGADALIFDLEDSAAEEEKDAARERLREHLRAAPAGGAMRIVRINPLRSRHGTEDLLMARASGIDALLLPKVETAEALLEAGEALAETDAPASLRLWAMIETPRGVRDAERIAATRPPVALAGLMVGPNDLVAAADLKPSTGRPELLPWLSRVVLAAKAEGIAVLDGVFNDLSDGAGFEAECRQARAMGFTGKTLIHPSQVAPANAAFGPDAADLARANAIVAAFADARGRGVVRLGDEMLERLHLASAEALIARARSLEKD